jgi:3-oxoadipate enol-lactonase
VRLYAEEHGEGHPLLLLTGLGYAIWSWRRQLPEWSKHFRCIAVENRGTGRSPKPPGPTSIEEMADDAAEMLGGRRAHVCGYSMGGYLAQALALRHPDLVERLVLVCTATGGPDVAPTPAETQETWLAHADRPPPEFARATMPLSFRPGWTDEHPDEFEELLSSRLEFPTPAQSWRAQYDACLDWAFASVAGRAAHRPDARDPRQRRPRRRLRERSRACAPAPERPLRDVPRRRAPAVHRGGTAVQCHGDVVPHRLES